MKFLVPKFHLFVVVTKSKGPCKGSLWLILSLAATGVMIWQIYNITITYISNPVLPVIVVESSRFLTFPAITICNTNPIKSSALAASESIQSLVESLGDERKRKKRSPEEGTNNSTDLLKRYKRAGSDFICVDIQPYGQICIINNANIEAVDGAAMCSAEGDYRLGCLETETKWQAVTNSSLFSDANGLLKNRYLIGLSSPNSSSYSWTSGVDYTYHIWRTGQDYSGPFTYVTGRIDHGHDWEVEINGNRRVMILCEANNVVTPVPDTTTTAPPTTTSAEVTTMTTPPETTTTPPTTTTTPPATTSDEVTTMTTPPETTTTPPTTTPPTTTTTPPVTVTTPKPTTPVFQSSHPEREPPREDFQQENDVIQALAELPEDVKRELGYDLDEFLLSCEYDGEECDINDFGEFFDAVHGNCYVFNAGWAGDQDDQNYKTAHTPGRGQGLKMTLNLGQAEYIQGVSQTAGVVVVVHSHRKMPFPEDEGVFAHPGKLTSIGITKGEIARLGGKYSNCTYETNLPEINMFEEHHRVNYSVNACYKTCYQRNVIETCSCSDPQYPNSGKALGNPDVPVCSNRDIEQDDCMYGVLTAFIQDELDCDCPIPCSETTYSYAMSTSQWPSAKYEDSLLESLQDKIPNLVNSSDVDEEVRRNLVRVEVYFQHFSYRYIYEKPKYPFTIYMADFASNLGLFLGMSLFSVFEVVEFCTDMLVLICCRQIAKLEPGRKDNDNDPRESVNRTPSQEFLIPQRDNFMSTNYESPRKTSSSFSLAAVAFTDIQKQQDSNSYKERSNSASSGSRKDVGHRSSSQSSIALARSRRVGTVTQPIIEGLVLASGRHASQRNIESVTPTGITPEWTSRKHSNVSTSSSVGSTAEDKNLIQQPRSMMKIRGKYLEQRKASNTRNNITEEETDLTYFVT